MKLEQITAFCSQDSTREYALTLPWVEDRTDLPASAQRPWLHASDGRILIRVDIAEVEGCVVEEILAAREGQETPPHRHMWQDFQFLDGLRECPECRDFPETPFRQEECRLCYYGLWTCDCPECSELHRCNACDGRGWFRFYEPEAHEIRGRRFASALIHRIHALPGARWLEGPPMPERLAFRFGATGEGLLMPLQIEEERRGEA